MPDPNRRRFLKVAGLGLFAASAARLPLPAPAAAVPPAATPDVPWGLLEVFTASGPERGTRLCSLAMPQPTGCEDGLMVFPDFGGTASASGTPRHGRITRYLADGREAVYDFPCGVGHGAIAFNSTLSAGGTVTIRGPGIVFA